MDGETARLAAIPMVVVMGCAGTWALASPCPNAACESPTGASGGGGGGGGVGGGGGGGIALDAAHCADEIAWCVCPQMLTALVAFGTG